MNSSNNNNFTPEEEMLITNTLAEHFAKPVDTLLADIEPKITEESA